MIHTVAKTIEIIAAVFTLAGVGYSVVCLWSAWAYLRAVERVDTNVEKMAWPNLPAVSLLKPLKGLDPEMYESFRSHCVQDYAAYELIFGVSDPDDPAIPAVLRLQKEFPQRRIELVMCSQKLGANLKVSNLVQMLSSARHDCLIVNDSDIRVGPDYLRQVVAPLSDSAVAMVTCLYRGVPSATLGSRLESLGISTDFAPGVLVARQLEGGIHFGLGSTLAFRRADLAAIGGFEVLVDFLADDYELGKRLAGSQRTVVLSGEVVDTFLPAYDFGAFLQHQLRWARAIRDSRPGGYFGLLCTFLLPWAVITAVAARGVPWAWGLLVVALLLRMGVALAVGRGVLRDRRVLRLLPLLPLRDGIAMLVWCASFASNTISWRGDSFTLKEGRLVRTTPQT